MTINFDTTDKAAPAEVKVAAIEPSPLADEATAALLKQLESLRASEQAQRDFANR